MNMNMAMLERLREETRAIHTRVEALPFFAALHVETLPLTAYVTFLEAMTTVHEALEQAAGAG